MHSSKRTYKQKTILGKQSRSDEVYDIGSSEMYCIYIENMY